VYANARPLFCTETNKQLLPLAALLFGLNSLISSYAYQSNTSSRLIWTTRSNMMVDRYVPGGDRVTRRPREFPPKVRSSRTNPHTRLAAPDPYRGWSYESSSTGQRSSSVSDDVKQLDTSLPKNFDKPLTCFFWHQFGRCNKRDVDCAYAHWDTGFMASAPINLPGCMAFSSPRITSFGCERLLTQPQLQRALLGRMPGKTP
jgi:hypothetical protein